MHHSGALNICLFVVVVVFLFFVFAVSLIVLKLYMIVIEDIPNVFSKKKSGVNVLCRCLPDFHFKTSFPSNVCWVSCGTVSNSILLV